MKNKIKKGEIARYILAGITVAGILFIGAAMPGVFEIFKLFRKQSGGRYSKRALSESLARLKRRGLIRFSQGSRGWRLELTDRGSQELNLYEIGEKLLKKPKKWDKRWRLLVFDIEEKRKNVRNQIRSVLISFGFYRLQDSVWVYPYECEEILELLRIKYRVRHEALYIRAEHIAKDEYLRGYFGLKQ